MQLELGKTKLKQETKPMCTVEPTSKQIADQAARQLIDLMNKDGLHINATPVILRLWLAERWDEVAKLAHQIHGGTG